MNTRDLLPTRRGFLKQGALQTAVLGLADRPVLAEVADTGPTADPIASLLRLEVLLAHWVHRQRDRILHAPPDGKGEGVPWADYGFKWPAYTLAHLWATKHPNNPLHGVDWCPGLALELYDKEVAGWLHRRDRGGRMSTGETPHYVAAYLLETLGERLGAERRKRWLEHEEAWVAQALARPLGQTGRYHDSWRFTALYRLGKVLDQPKWSERGVELFHEMLKLQTREGFWAEQRGPSFRYHGLMLPSLAWMYRWTGEEAFRRSAEKLVRFLTTYVHPDGIGVGPFDVRNINVMAYFPTCAGLELLPEGRAYAARAFRLWQDLDMFGDVGRTAVCTRDVARVAFYAADTCRYLSQYAAKPEQALAADGALPIDRDGVLQNHSAEFDGLLVRKGAWVAALSGQSPDGPRQSKSPYMLDGQSRIELWHRKGRVVLGGGHNHRDWPIPLANVFLVSDPASKSEFGRPDPGPREARLGGYLPQAVSTSIHQDVPELTLKFSQGSVHFRIHVKDERQVEIAARWELQGVQRLCLQMPVVVWRGAELLLDGTRASGKGSPFPLRSEARVQGGPFAQTYRLLVPAGAPCRVHYPQINGQLHDQVWIDDPITNPYDVALVSSQWRVPARKGEARYVVRGEW